MSGRSRDGRASSRWSLRWPGTRRAAILVVVVCALGLTVAVPLRTYLGQRAEIAAQIHQRQQLRGELAHLRHSKAQLSDPAHIEAEARRRLRYVMPGETPYVVQLPQESIVPGTEHTPASKQDRTRPPWYEGLWHDVTQGH